MMFSREMNRFLTTAVSWLFGIRTPRPALVEVSVHDELKPHVAAAANQPRTLANQSVASARRGYLQGTK